MAWGKKTREGLNGETIGEHVQNQEEPRAGAPENGLYEISLTGKILTLYIVLKQVDDEGHLPTLTLAKVRFVVCYIDHWGTAWAACGRHASTIRLSGPASRQLSVLHQDTRLPRA